VRDRKVYCDKCYKLTSVKEKEMKHPRGIIERYFKCEHCYWQYTVAVTNDRARKLIRKMKGQRDMAREQKDPIKLAYYQYKDKEYTIYDPKKDADVLITKCKEQIELDKIMDRLKHNLINYGVADL